MVGAEGAVDAVAPARSGGGGRGGPVQIFAAGRPPQTDPRLAPKELDTLTTKFRQITTSMPDRVVRPGFGIAGAAITLRTNFFALKYPKNLVLRRRSALKRLFELLESTAEFAPFLSDVAHDRTQKLISRRRLPANLAIGIPFFEEGEAGPRDGGKVYVIEFTGPLEHKSAELDKYLQGDDVDYDPLPIIAAFNLITSSHAAHTTVPFGRNRYFVPPSSLRPPEQAFPLSAGLEAWKGFYTSVRPVFKQLMVNVNICMSAFYVPNSKLSDAMLTFDRESRGAGNPREFYKNVRITTTHLGYRRRCGIKGFGPKTARDTVFQCDELGGKVSVEQYFKRKYKITLEHADDIPIVNMGNKTKDVFVPAEVCEIEAGQSFTGVLSRDAISKMIRYACRPPYDNARLITEQGFPTLGFQRKPASPLPGFDIQVSLDMAVIPGRTLTPPRVVYAKGRQARVSDGSWNILDITFHRPAALTNYSDLVLADGGDYDFRSEDDPELQNIIDGFKAKCSRSGMAVDEAEPLKQFLRLPRPGPRGRAAAIDRIEEKLRSLPSHINLVLVFMSNGDPDIYPGLKKLCDFELGILTVCMLMPKVRERKRQDQYFSNIALKVNTKLGGINHILDENSTAWLKDSMLVGMDVTHSGVGCVKGTPSIAAVVASCDDGFMHYPASLRLQKHREEMIEHVKEMMIERLNEYRRVMETLPDRVLVFRDGVSEGQFDKVLKEELPGIKDAFRSFESYAPKLTIAICGKRHHTRFYPTSTDHADRTSNTKAGTIVDQGVTTVYDFDYYLQAHAGLQGTVRPTHYSVIYVESEFSADTLQQGTNDVSYLWARATKSVSVIPPAYWADRACDRARMYLHGIMPPPPNAPERRMSEEKIKHLANELWGNGVHNSLKSTMFYL